MNTGTPDQHIRDIKDRLSVLGKEQRELTALLENLQQQKQPHSEPSQNHPVTIDPVTPDRIKLFMSLFRGRDDVFPKRWDNAKSGKSAYSPVCKNEWVKSVCNKPKIPCGVCTNQAFMPVTEDIIRKHLCGDISSWQPRDYTIGVYPMLKDESCWFLAVDFDRGHWQKDAHALVATCRAKNIPVAVERSRSGNGAHAWIFFAQNLSAAVARKLGAYLLYD